jgi:tellurite resistance-related uncharacterized protein
LKNARKENLIKNAILPLVLFNKGNAERGISPRLKILPGDLDL